MKKIISLISAALLMIASAAGCNSEEKKKTDIDMQNKTQSAESTESANPEADKTVEPRKLRHVLDTSGILSESEFNDIENYIAIFSNRYKINSAIVVTDDINDKSPETAANDYFNEFFQDANGLLLLVNDDTGIDFVFANRSPSLFINEDDKIQILADISPLLASGDYLGAVKKTFEFFEQRIPQFVTDRTNTLEKDEMLLANQMLSKACGEEDSLSIIYTSSTGNMFAEYVQSQSEKYLSEQENTAILFVNPQTGEGAVKAKGSLESLEEANELFSAAVSDYFANGTGDIIGLADLYINFAGK